jgi:hypothetical protein
MFDQDTAKALTPAERTFLTALGSTLAKQNIVRPIQVKIRKSHFSVEWDYDNKEWSLFI